MIIPQHQGEKNRPGGYYMIYDQGVLGCQYQYLGTARRKPMLFLANKLWAEAKSEVGSRLMD